MSRIGKRPIQIPSAVTVNVADGVVAVKGPKGELSLALHPRVSIAQEGGSVSVAVKNPDLKEDRALWGLSARLIGNMVTGVVAGYEKRLEINGVGYRAAVEGDALNLNLGFSHPVKFSLPKGITAAVEKNIVVIRGIDKQQVGETAARIRALRKPEPYKGKGIKYIDEIVRRKAGKQVKAAGAGAA
ncbi:50S ribosomal protein L6 [Candidatus Uhrbacteria bacterium RIFCSPHIGHO2_12_FULL_54_23]|uniref:Large ribosomal subunit protein uL6 n=3 Tax=Candidatus Uhriibacteriota TaxID=1752732 RepID=A0A1F7UJV0_9BACT|nr:MAG: 50S ribosomal protein L6 [Candidatus Uhrbacteria bacterium RIFCSPHIGHO2_12_FULL_54_23]OGL83636.1 MAG: 50S ribosomal protein L6 [Candidatus Uhrbacteria bacterium RIFCSPLOWO2_01_FULL_55_36]OGL90007.1 MAG: 50S ribosomal protein L6 [Candidatus Uhrbacteria bacterium RIFCSPLOWO2_02_FULL_54_37]